MRYKGNLQISARTLLSIIGVALCVSFFLSVSVSHWLSRKVLVELRSREIEVIFGAIEAGPLAIARLHAGAIAQAQLDRLIASEGLLNRNIISVEIFGGENGTYDYAHWQSKQQHTKKCTKVIERNFNYANSIHDFIVRLKLDTCEKLSEEKQIDVFTLEAFSMVYLLIIMTFFLITLPVVQALRASVRVLRNINQTKEVDGIYFKPIKELTALALASVHSERERTSIKIAQQVAHDIRSPVSALEAVYSSLGKEPPEEMIALMKHSIERIRSIAYDLNKSANTKLESVDLAALVQLIIDEKRFEYCSKVNIKIEYSESESASKIFVNINLTELSRLVSNLINNAVESLVNEAGTVHVSITKYDDKNIRLIIKDTGKGIPKEILPRLGTRGYSHGKEGSSSSGSGLGLYHAKSALATVGGTLSIDSELSRGTKVEILLPIFQLKL